jgi:hypothetical protein
MAVGEIDTSSTLPAATAALNSLYESSDGPNAGATKSWRSTITHSAITTYQTEKRSCFLSIDIRSFRPPREPHGQSAPAALVSYTEQPGKRKGRLRNPRRL